MSATIQVVRPLDAVDASRRSVRDIQGRPVLDSRRHPEIAHYRLRWKVAGEKNYRSLLLDGARPSAARAAYDELTAACRLATPVGSGGWPANSTRPATRPSATVSAARNGTAVAAAVVSAAPATASNGLDPVASRMTVSQFFEAHVRPAIVVGAGSNHVAGQRSAIKFLADRLPRHPDGRELAMCEITTSQIQDVHAVRLQDRLGRNEIRPPGPSTLNKFEIALRRTFALGAEMYPAAVVADPFAALDKALRTASRRRRRRPNQLDPATATVTPSTSGGDSKATYRDARRMFGVADIEEQIAPVLPEWIMDLVRAVVGTGTRTCELAAFERADVDLEALTVTVDKSVTLHSPRDNRGIRLVETSLKEGVASSERFVPILPRPEIVGAIHRAIATAPARAAERKAALESGSVQPRSDFSDPDRWLASELLFASKQKLFTMRSGAPLDMTNVDEDIGAALDVAFAPGDPRRELRFYDLRSIYENHLLDVGVPAAVVQTIVGHSAAVQRASYREQSVPTLAQVQVRLAGGDAPDGVELNDVPAAPSPAAVTATADRPERVEPAEPLQSQAKVFDFAAERKARRVS